MKAWLKGGLIGVGIGILIFAWGYVGGLLNQNVSKTFFISDFISQIVSEIIQNKTGDMIIIINSATIIGIPFLIGSIIGLIIQKIKSRRNK